MKGIFMEKRYKEMGYGKVFLICFITAAVIFLPGCNFRCGYCHNPELVTGRESALDVHEEVRLLVSEVENHLYKWEKNVL